MTDAARGGVVAQARAEREAGATWRARDLLAAHVETHPDPEALGLLGEVLHDMGDLPRAGAIWFAAGARGAEVDAAVAAWREQSHDDFGVMWRSLPAAVRTGPLPRRLEALRERAGAAAVEDAGAEGSGATDAGAVTTASPDAGAVATASTDAGPHEAGDESSSAVRSGGAGQDDEDSGLDVSWVVAWILAIAFVVFAVIGFVTALGWVVPG